MKFFRDGVVVLGIATLTALLVTPLVGPGIARAKDEVPAVEAPKAPSTLEAAGMTLSLAFHKKAYGEGDKPVIRLTAVGGTIAAKAEVTVRMHATTPISRMARMLPLPQEVFVKKVPISLEPGETKTIELPTEHAVAKGTTSSLSIAVGDKHVTAGSFSIPGEPLTLLVPLIEASAGLSKRLPKVKLDDGVQKLEIVTK